MTPKGRVFLVAVSLAILVDQLSKLWVESAVDLGDRSPVLNGFFYLTHVRNPGAAFGLFTDLDPGWRRGAFIGVSLVVAAVIASFFRRLAPGDRRTSLALALILGGAVGNFCDRILRGEVVDFMHFRWWGGYAWPDFNFADMFIVVGVAALILDLLASEAASRAGTTDPPD
jgi:signal peptidase II